MLINFYALSNFGLSCVLSRSVLVELDHICKSVSLRETACQENYSGKLKQTSTKAACLFSVGKVSKREFSFFLWTRSRFWTSEAAVIYILFTVLENNVVGHFSPFFLSSNTVKHCFSFHTTDCRFSLFQCLIVKSYSRSCTCIVSCTCCALKPTTCCWADVGLLLEAN